MTQHSKPQRPVHDVTQAYNDGIVRICSVTDVAEPGLLPEPKLQSVIALPYEERRLGIRRYYEARQNQIQVERVLRVPKPAGVVITTQHVAATEDENKYRIDLIQNADVYPPSLDLTLAKYVQGVAYGNG